MLIIINIFTFDGFLRAIFKQCKDIDRDTRPSMIEIVDRFEGVLEELSGQGDLGPAGEGEEEPEMKYFLEEYFDKIRELH